MDRAIARELARRGRQGLRAMAWRAWRGAVNSTRRLAVEQPLRSACMVSVLTIVWLLLGALFQAVLLFLDQDQYVAFKPRLLESLLGVFFFALSFLVTMSDTVVVWGALFRTRSAVFHAQTPLDDRGLFWCAAIEGGLWSSWAVLVLALPLVGVLMRTAASPWAYAGAASLSLIAFVACCVAGGAVGALLLARMIPLLRRGATALIVVALIALAVAAVQVVGNIDREQRPTTFIHEVIGRLGFTENPLLPSQWIQQALMAARESRWGDWAFHLGLLVGGACTAAFVGEAVAHRRLRIELDALHARGEGKRTNRSRTWRLPPLLPRDLALLAAKDLRLFVRDPAQVLQFTMFFGLLTFYLMMLPRLGRAFLFEQTWRPAVSLLNLTAISMALATFTGRFVYPLLSLEGKRLWVLILAPWPKQRVVTAKLAFALLVGLPVSVALVSLSGIMLELPAHVIAYQILVIACMAVGLSAGALGIGARLADYNEDNPGKIVAGYGGNINLLASLLFTGLLLAGAAVPLLRPTSTVLWAGGVAWTLVVTAAWSTVALRVAWSWFGRA